MPGGPGPAAAPAADELAADLNDDLDRLLADDDVRRVARYPGDPTARQPVHTVYVPGDRFDAETPGRWGAKALGLLERFAPDTAALAAATGLPPSAVAGVLADQGPSDGRPEPGPPRTLPDGLVVTLPKVTSVDQVRAMVHVCDRLESQLDLPPRSLRLEIQIETAQTGVRLSDGSTNVMAFADADEARDTWTLHTRLVTRALQRGYYQGWDMHPGHLPPGIWPTTCSSGP